VAWPCVFVWPKVEQHSKQHCANWITYQIPPSSHVALRSLPTNLGIAMAHSSRGQYLKIENPVHFELFRSLNFQNLYTQIEASY
jgi:hypothetical protein